MSLKSDPRLKQLEQPIFCLCTLKDYVIMASGGGGKKYGVRNKIQSYRITNNKFSEDIIHSVEFEKEIPVYIDSLESMNIFSTCVNNLVIFFELEERTGQFRQIHRLTIMESFDPDTYVNVCKFDSRGQLLAAGSTDGTLSVWKLNISRSKIDASLLQTTKAHYKSINDIVFIEEKNMIVTGSSDTYTKIFEINTLKLLKKLTFRKEVSEKFNYAVRGVKYDKYKGWLMTVQSATKKGSYLTKWNVYNNFEPVSSLKVSDTIITSMDYSQIYHVIGLGDCDGNIIYLDASGNTSFISRVTIGDITVKTVSFYQNNLISGTADNTLKLNYSAKPRNFSFAAVIKLLVLAMFIYYLTIKMRNTPGLAFKI